MSDPTLGRGDSRTSRTATKPVYLYSTILPKALDTVASRNERYSSRGACGQPSTIGRATDPEAHSQSCRRYRTDYQERSSPDGPQRKGREAVYHPFGHIRNPRPCNQVSSRADAPPVLGGAQP